MVAEGQGSGARTGADWRAAIGAVALVLALAGLAIGGEWLWLAVPALLCLLIAIATVPGREGAREQALQQAQEDHRQLVDLPAQATWVADPEGRLIFVSERWTEWTGVIFEPGAANWVETIHPEDKDRVLVTWAGAVAAGTPHDQEHRIRFRDGSYHWVRARAFPQRHREGEIVRWIGQVEDIHDRRVAEEQLRQTATLLELIGSSTESVIWAKDREGRMLYMNRALERLAGLSLSDVLGKTDAEWNDTPGEAEAFRAADQRILETGQAEDLEEVFTGRGRTTRTYRSIKSPLRDHAGNVIGVVGVATDITERREAEQRERLLTRELDHRAKNLLAVVQSVVTLTRAGTLNEFKEAVEGRIHALGRAHSMLAASRWEGADLSRIVSEELSPYDNGRPGRLQVSGPPLVLRPAVAQSLGLVIHELATNAVKYGALSTEQGQLEVQWEVGEGEAGSPGLRFRWTERGGPPPAQRSATSRNGFGTRLIHSSIERQLAGSLHFDWAQEGLSAMFTLPLDRPSAVANEATPAAPAPERTEAA
jgi:PAS domain S-box-containing protein